MARDIAAVAMLMTLVVASGAAVRAESELHGSRLVRSANFRHGALQTSRWAESVGNLPGSSGAVATDAVSSGTVAISTRQLEVWALGFDPEAQDEVDSSLQALGGSVLRVLPGRSADDYHWLVKASASAITQLLAQHEGLTAARLPVDMKLSPSVDAAIRNAKAGRQVTLLVTMPHATPEELSAAAQAARQELGALVGQGCKLAAAPLNRAHSLSITVCSQSVQVVATWAVQQGSVTWVSVAPQIQLNNLYANAAVQNNKKLTQGILANNGSAPPEVLTEGVDSGYLPLWKAGLTGKNEVVGVFDTGIDTDSCFFFDPDVPDITKAGNATKVVVEYSSELINATVYTSHKHRKVVQLTRVSDAVDSNGHGTHVCATVAGSAYGFDPLKHPSLATGIAPDAKLAVVDVSKDKVDTVMDGWSFDNVHQIYDIVREAGARITSTSLSYRNFDDDGYNLAYSYTDEFCYQWDAYTWQRPDMLHMCSAGNEGDHAGFEYVSVPALCKNTMAVGATDGWFNLPLLNITYNMLAKNGSLVPPENWNTWIRSGFEYSGTYIPSENIASYSSFKSGLGFDGKIDFDPWPRIKPDLAAPGLVLSAATDKATRGRMDQCSVKMGTGTSMATPVVSGAAAIVRQYFKDGFYPTGAARRSDALDPSGTLVKAVLLAGTAAMQGYRLVDMSFLTPPPSPFQGFGRVDLSASLPLASDPTWRMKVFEGEFKSTRDTHKYTVRIGNNRVGRPLVVVLAWYDWPSAENTGGLLLVNDLDLVVTDERGNTYQVNGRKTRDSTNTVEKVYIPLGLVSAGNTFTITVTTASPLFKQALPQPYSVVVLGPLSEPVPASPAPSPTRRPAPKPPVGFPPCRCRSDVSSPYRLVHTADSHSMASGSGDGKVCFTLSTQLLDTSTYCGRGANVDLRKIELDIDPACHGAVKAVTFGNKSLAPIYGRYTLSDGKHATLRVARGDSATNLLGTYQQLQRKPTQVCLVIRKGSHCTSLQSLCRSGTCWASFFSPSNKCCPVSAVASS